MEIKRTDSTDPDFVRLVRMLDADLAERDGAENAFYSQYNKIDMIRHAVVIALNGEASACGAMKEFEADSMEIKRMYTHPEKRGQGLAKSVLAALEAWAKESGYRSCVLETGKRQPEAIALYASQGYFVIENYGQYAGVENSVCFRKDLQ
jgi:putative acetyltransferase